LFTATADIDASEKPPRSVVEVWRPRLR